MLERTKYSLCALQWQKLQKKCIVFVYCLCLLSLSIVFVYCLCLLSLSIVFVYCLCLLSLSIVFGKPRTCVQSRGKERTHVNFVQSADTTCTHMNTRQLCTKCRHNMHAHEHMSTLYKVQTQHARNTYIANQFKTSIFYSYLLPNNAH